MKKTKNQVFFFILISVAFLTLSCSLGTWGGPHLKKGKLTLPQNPFFGKHFPQGQAAVQYAYSSEGMWKNIESLEYRWNYYEKYSTLNHPYNRNALIAFADGTHFTTAKDANGHLLFQIGLDQTDPRPEKYAFHEHNGRGGGGIPRGQPFTHFWFDDNWLASIMSKAYGTPEPQGLSENLDFVRWSVLSGDLTNWTPYQQGAPDQLALDGIFYSQQKETGIASELWQRMIQNSAPTGGPDDLYSYPSISEEYHLGLMKIFTDFLIEISDSPNSESLPSISQESLLRHSLSLGNQLLITQEKRVQDSVISFAIPSEPEEENFLGWTSGVHDPNSLMNIETVAVNSLALGALASWTFQPGLPPLKKPTFVDSCESLSAFHFNESPSRASGIWLPPLIRRKKSTYLTPGYILKAVKRNSSPRPQAELLTEGPFYEIPPGHYRVEFYLKSPAKEGKLLSIQISDLQSKVVLISQIVSAESLGLKNEWTKVSLPIQIQSADNSINIQTCWPGIEDVDLALIKIRQPSPLF